MSGPGIHHIIARETIKKMKQQPGTTAAFQTFLTQADGLWSPYLHFGCQGPDPLFFNTKDISPLLRDGVETYLDVIDFIEGFKQAIKDLIPPEVYAAAAALEGAWNDVAARSVLLTELQQSLTEARNAIELLKGTLETGLKKYVTDSFNVFDTMLTHPMQDKGMYAPGRWWWFDTLHYRRTGDYALQLLRNAKPNTPEMAYAIGYLTHFAADTVGHPFVNAVSGGPYRTHAQRHKFIENHQDVYAWRNFYGGQEFIQSKVGDQYIIDGNEKALPPALNALILKTIDQVYVQPGLNYGSPMTSSDLNDTYRIWLAWFRATTNTLDLPAPVPYSLTKEMQEAWETFTNNLGDIGDMISNAAQGVQSIWDVLRLLAAAALGAVLAAAAAIDFVLGSMATLGAAPIRMFVSLTYEFLYNAFQDFHQAVALTGLAFPFNKQLSHFAAQHVFNPSFADPTGTNAADVKPGMPYKKFKVSIVAMESHLIYPRPFGPSPADYSEQSPTTVAPDSYFDQDPFFYMWGPIKLNPDFYQYAKQFTESATTPADVQTVENNFRTLQQLGARGGLGNAVDFSTFLHSEFLNGRTIPNFNLDADRGYAFPSWRRVSTPADFNNANVTHVAVEEAPVFAQHQVLNIETDILHPNLNIL
jgi:hypothetical protein